MYSGTLNKEFITILIAMLKSVDTKIFKDMTLKVSKKGMTMYSIDESKSSMILGEFNLDEVFDSKDISKLAMEVLCDIPTTKVKRVLNALKGETIDIEYTGTDLILESKKGKYKIPVYDPDDFKLDEKVNKLVYNTEFQTTPSIFFEKFDAGTILFDKELAVFHFNIKDKKLSIRTESDGMSRNSYDYTFLDDEITFGLDKDKDVKGMYSHIYLKLAKLPIKEVFIKLNTEYPLMLHYKFKNKSHIKYVIAPRVEN